MSSKQIRVSAENYERLARRRRNDESFDEVIDRLLDDDRDLLAGFGTADEGRIDRMRESRKRSKRQSKARIARLARNRGHIEGSDGDE